MDFKDTGRKLKNGKKGAGMVEVLVSFVILLLCLAMITTCMGLATGLIFKAKRMDQNNAALEQGIAEKESVVAGTDSSIYDGLTSSGSINYNFENVFSFSVNKAQMPVTVTDSSGNASTTNINVFSGS
ncbi:MAG TPA: hypothetical protein PLN48_08575 [Lachnospiraceae bacterium]|nr:hypothetical protein [Lachnospiraceae bacterium]